MARISVKYPIGTKVTMHGKVDGIVTAIFIRGKNKAYECSYIDSNGNPTSNTLESCEINKDGSGKIGFTTT